MYRNTFVTKLVNNVNSDAWRIGNGTRQGGILSPHMYVDRVLNSFLKQFNSMYYKFNFLDRSLLFYLFKTYTSSFYGAETWYKPCRKSIHKISVSYHKAVKRISGLNVWDSNHEACSIVKAPIFRHLIARRSFCFFSSILKSSSPCILPYKYFLKYHSEYFLYLNHLFRTEYGVLDIWNNPVCAVLARIQFVQDREPRMR